MLLIKIKFVFGCLQGQVWGVVYQPDWDDLFIGCTLKAQVQLQDISMVEIVGGATRIPVLNAQISKKGVARDKALLVETFWNT